MNRLTEREGRSASLAALFTVWSSVAWLGACSRDSEELPPVKTPLGVHLPCRPPSPFPWLGVPAPGGSCGLKPLQCHETERLVVRVDREGRVLEAFIREQRSPSIDACILDEVRHWSFEPARECNGDPMPGEFTSDYGIICDGLGGPHSQVEPGAAEQGLAPDEPAPPESPRARR